MYDSIEDMPIVNFQKYNRYLLIDSGIGCDLEDIDSHISKIMNYIASDKALAMQELQNMRQALYFINQEISPKYMAFVTLIHEIDGQKVTDLSDDNLKELITKISSVKKTWLDRVFDELKKKVGTELETYFPAFFDNVKEKEAYDKLRQRVMLVLNSIITDKRNNAEINDIDEYLLSLSKPKQFNGNKSIEVLYSKQFENTCILIAQKTGLDVKKMTVFEFYTTLEQVKKQVEAETKQVKHRR